MPTLTVRPARSSGDRAAFLDFPYALYADAPHYVPPLRLDQKHVLDPRKNPFFEHGAIETFLAERGGRVVGRVAAIENGQHLAKYADGNGFFGFFDTVDDLRRGGGAPGRRRRLAPPARADGRPRAGQPDHERRGGACW